MAERVTMKNYVLIVIAVVVLFIGLIITFTLSAPEVVAVSTEMTTEKSH